MNIAHFDMDGSLFDFEGALRESLESLRSPNDPEIPENLWNAEKEPWMKARMKLIKSVPGFWLNLNPIPAGFEIYRMAKEIGFDCKILTKGPRTGLAWMEKFECCIRHFGPDIDIQIVSDKEGKGRVYGKVLYDDFTDFMTGWLDYRPRGLGIMPVNAANKDFTHPNVVKWDGTNREEVRAALVQAFNREVRRK